jgi:creatinine amidohydrolase
MAKEKFFIPIVICMVLAFMVLTSNPVSAADAPSISSGGYSIFHGTMADMTWVEVDKAAKDGAVVIFPTAGITQFGPAMPTAGNTYETYIWARHIRKELEDKGVRTIIAPPFYWAINRHNADYPGTFNIRPEIVKGLLSDAVANLNKWGFKNVFFGSWHGLNEKTIMEVCKEANSNLGIKAALIFPVHRVRSSYGLTGKEEHVLIVPSSEVKKPYSKYVNFHAGSNEVSYMSAYYPDLVDLDLVKTLKPTNLTGKEFGMLIRQPGGLAKRTPGGYVGDPASYDAKWGKAYIESSARMAAKGIATYLDGTYKLPENFGKVTWGSSKK